MDEKLLEALKLIREECCKHDYCSTDACPIYDSIMCECGLSNAPANWVLADGDRADISFFG